VKHYYAVYVAVFVSFLVGLATLYIILPYNITPKDPLWGLILFIPCSILHELSHYAVAKKYNPEASIKVVLRLGAVALDYVSLNYREYVKVAVTPLLTVQLPITILYVVTHNASILVLNILHIVSSSVDIMGLIYNSVKHYGGKFHLVYDEKGGISGVLVEDPAKDRKMLYIF